jgi:uncharacterized membrane protein
VTVTTKPVAARPRVTPGGGRHAARSPHAAVRAHGALLVLIAVLVPLHRVWAAQLLLVVLLLTVPGVILLRALRVPGRAVASFPVYVPAGSLAVLLAAGLAVDVAGPALGVSQPLRMVPLLAGAGVVCAALLAVSVRAPAETAIPWASLTGGPAWLAWPLFLPVLAAAGALRLNNGHGDGFAVAAICACAAVLVWTMAIAPRLNETTLMLTLYAMALAMVWSFSLRGDLVYGFDISTEYYDMEYTVRTGVWHFAHPGNAYSAMLSVTVLPAELHALSGVPALLIIKVLYPALNALYPVAIYGLGRMLLNRRWAFAASAFIVIQSPFSQELPGVARQEIALLFFMALTGAMFDTRLARYQRWALVTVFGLGMVVSHYSTTYLALALLAVMLFGQWAMSWCRDIPRLAGAVAVAFVVFMAAAAIWYGPVTRSAANVSQFAHQAAAQGFDFLPDRTTGESPLVSYLEGNTQATMGAARYQQLVHGYYERDAHFVHPLPDAAEGRYALHGSTVPVPPVRLPRLHSAIGAGGVVATQLAYLLAGLSTVFLALRRGTPLLVRQFALMGTGALLVLTLTRLSGTIANAYNQERALVQSMTILGIVMCWTLQRAAAYLKQRSALVLIAATAALTVIYATGSGLVNAIMGGAIDTNLANSGEDFERYYVTTPELASASWLGQHVEPGQLVYADRYASLRLTAMTGMAWGVLPDVTPQTLDHYAWIYASRTNTIDHRARADFENKAVVYAFPVSFIEANFNTVYTDGSSEVFHR